MSNQVVPIANLGTRMPEHGRIRMGVKTANAMKSIDTFRFTSPDSEAIQQIAELYGGVAKPWNEPKAKIQAQFEVITQRSDIRIFLPPFAMSSWYELWAGGGCTRRCDGIVCQVPQTTGPDAGGMAEVDCICAAENAMKCRPYTRLNVVLPEIRFGGAWRLETKGWNAAHEMPAMAAMIEQLQAVGMVEARLLVEKRHEVKNGKTKNFVVPKLLIDTSPLAILQGQASVGAITEGTARPAITAGPTPTPPPDAPSVEPPAQPVSSGEWFDQDDMVVDAEIVDEPPTPVNLSERAAKRGGLSKAETKLVIETQAAAERLLGLVVGPDGGNLTDDELRHALVWRLTERTSESSRDLTDEQRSKMLDVLPRIGVDETLQSWVATVLNEYRNRPR